MSEIKTQEAVVDQQPATQAQPSQMSKLQQVTGTEEWHDDIFNCFEGPDNLCTLLLSYRGTLLINQQA